MNPKNSLVIMMMLVTPLWLQAQSSTTDALNRKYSGSLSLFFYNNTLRMLNQSEDPEFDEVIRDIEKMKFLMIRKSDTGFDNNDMNKLVSDYKSESFEEIMTSRHEGKSFDVFLKEQGGKTKGMLVLINDSTHLYVLDILGKIALDKVGKLYSTLDESTDIGDKIKAFTGKPSDSGHKDENSDKNH